MPQTEVVLVATQARSSKVALVTGSAKRVGKCIVQTLHAAGWRVVVHYARSALEASELSDTLNDIRPDSAMALAGDLKHIGEMPAMVRQVVQRWGRLDALVHNASTFFPTPLGSATAKQWTELFDANARGPFFLSQAAAPELIRSRGSIVSIADIYARRPQSDHAIYIMAKAALEAMTRSLAVDLAPHVRVNAIAPGAVLWPESPSPYESQAELVGRTPLARCGSPSDVANSVRWLIEDASFITGQVLTVDGGRTLPV